MKNVNRRYCRIAGVVVRRESDLPITDRIFMPRFRLIETDGSGDDRMAIRKGAEGSRIHGTWIHKPALVGHPAGTLALSGDALLSLMKAVLDRDVPFRFEARGTSMAPFIRNGDIVTVRPARERPLRKGDVVAFAEPSTNKLYVHRIIRASGGRYAVKGDNVPKADGVIPGSCIVGVVAKVEGRGREISLGVSRGRALIADMSRIGALPVTARRAVGAFLRILRRRGTR